MFHSARLKLTGWYLLIIILISTFFSAVIYIRVCQELEVGFHRVEIRHKAEELGIPIPRRWERRLETLDPRLQDLRPPPFLSEDLKAAKKRVGFNLLMIDGIILIVSAGAGYFLAGKTLRPIEKTMEEQKRFVADASHELRTPLTALKTSMEVALRDKKISLNQAKRTIKSNLDDVNELQALSDNLLKLTNYQTNGKSLVFENVDIDQVVKKACQKILPLTKKKNIDLKTKVKKQIIYANKESLEQMILIFLDNAVKYTPKNGRITAVMETDKKKLILKVKDTGIGIAKKDIPHIFDRFYRADQSRSKGKVAGFGLGLSLAKKIIEIHKGSVKVNSALGKGAAFTIKLPLKY